MIFTIYDNIFVLSMIVFHYMYNTTIMKFILVVLEIFEILFLLLRYLFKKIINKKSNSVNDIYEIIEKVNYFKMMPKKVFINIIGYDNYDLSIYTFEKGYVLKYDCQGLSRNNLIFDCNNIQCFTIELRNENDIKNIVITSEYVFPELYTYGINKNKYVKQNDIIFRILENNSNSIIDCSSFKNVLKVKYENIIRDKIFVHDKGNIFLERIPKVLEIINMFYLVNNGNLIRNEYTNLFFNYCLIFYNHTLDHIDNTNLIKTFIKEYNINENEYHYENNFRDFFSRKFKNIDESRPLDVYLKNNVICCCDSKFIFYPSENLNTNNGEYWIKGNNFNLYNLLISKYSSESHINETLKNIEFFRKYSLGIFRLSPDDYHYVHIPLEADLIYVSEIISGVNQYSISPSMLKFEPYTTNKRVYLLFRNDDKLYMLVIVSSIGVNDLIFYDNLERETKLKDLRRYMKENYRSKYKLGSMIAGFKLGSTVLMISNFGICLDSYIHPNSIKNNQYMIETKLRCRNSFGIIRKF